MKQKKELPHRHHELPHDHHIHRFAKVEERTPKNLKSLNLSIDEERSPTTQSNIAHAFAITGTSPAFEKNLLVDKNKVCCRLSGGSLAKFSGLHHNNKPSSRLKFVLTFSLQYVLSSVTFLFEHHICGSGIWQKPPLDLIVLQLWWLQLPAGLTTVDYNNFFLY